jgi:hypothetical protein
MSEPNQPASQPQRGSYNKWSGNPARVLDELTGGKLPRDFIEKAAAYCDELVPERSDQDQWHKLAQEAAENLKHQDLILARNISKAKAIIHAAIAKSHEPAAERTPMSSREFWSGNYNEP